MIDLSQFAPGGPVQPALEWLNAVWEDEFDIAWQLTDPSYRLVLTQAWVRANCGHPDVLRFEATELAVGLAEPSPTHEMWPSFADCQLEEIQQGLGNLYSDAQDLGEQDDLGWGVASRPRPVAPDYELVVLAECGPDGDLYVEPTPVPEAALILMHYGEDLWRVAGLNSDRILEPEEPFEP